MGGLTERDLRIALTGAGLAGDERVGTDLAEHGVADAVSRWLAGQGPPGAAHRVRQALDRVAAVHASAAACGAVFIAPGDPHWPTALDDLDTLVPFGLWCRGDVTQLTGQPMVAVVGARAASAYGERVAAQIAAEVAQACATTVSGGAFGVDAAAHRGALAGHGVTIAVLAGGVDVAYPAAHTALFDHIATAGVVVSEAAPGSAVRKHLFLTRNRIIAALAGETVVVEAALRSGAISTANWAAALGRRVWGVPGPITSPTSAGVNRALALGAMEVLADVGQLTHALAANRPPALGGDVTARVAAVLRSTPATVDELVRSIPQLTPDMLQAALVVLELTGAAAHDTRGWRAIGVATERG